MKHAYLFSILLALTVFAAAQPEPERGEMHWKEYEDGEDVLRLFVGGTLAEPRRTSRLFYWHPAARRSAGEIFVSHGSPQWTEKIGEAMETLKSGLTWRLGSSFWTILDTNLPLRISDVRLRPGQYYLGVNRSSDGQDWMLAVISPDEVRERHMDAFETHIRQVPVRHTAPLRFEKTEEIADRLRIFLNADEADPRKVSMEIDFGPYRLSTDIEIEVYPKVVESE